MALQLFARIFCFPLLIKKQLLHLPTSAHPLLQWGHSTDVFILFSGSLHYSLWTDSDKRSLLQLWHIIRHWLCTKPEGAPLGDSSRSMTANAQRIRYGFQAHEHWLAVCEVAWTHTHMLRSWLSKRNNTVHSFAHCLGYPEWSDQNKVLILLRSWHTIPKYLLSSEDNI